MATALIHPMTRPTRCSSEYSAANLSSRKRTRHNSYSGRTRFHSAFTSSTAAGRSAWSSRNRVCANRSPQQFELGHKRRQKSRSYGMAHIREVEILDYADHRHWLASILGRRQGATD